MRGRPRWGVGGGLVKWNQGLRKSICFGSREFWHQTGARFKAYSLLCRLMLADLKTSTNRLLVYWQAELTMPWSLSLLSPQQHCTLRVLYSFGKTGLEAEIGYVRSIFLIEPFHRCKTSNQTRLDRIKNAHVYYSWVPRSMAGGRQRESTPKTRNHVLFFRV